MAKKKEEEKGNSLAETTHDELAAVFGEEVDFDEDGLGEASAEDIRLAAKVFNMKGTDENGDPIAANTFFDTVEEKTQKHLDIVPVNLHKTNEWREFDPKADTSVIRCRSFDRKTGVMDDGTERSCEGCPDAQWRSDETGKRTRRCSPVYNLFAIDRENQQPCVIRFKKTSLPVIKSFLNKHYILKRVVKGKRKNYPLFMWRVRASLRMDESGKYAIPVLERGELLSREEIENAAEAAKFVRESLLPELDRVSEADHDASAATNGEGGEGGDASFNPNDFSDGDGGGGEEQPAAEGANNRF